MLRGTIKLLAAAALLASLAGQTLPERVGGQKLPAGGREIQPGTPGRALPAPPGAAPALRLALVGGLPDEAAAGTVARGLALLAPDAAFLTGDLLPERPPDVAHLAAALQVVRPPLDGLSLPWYPCAAPGLLGGAERPFVAAYQRYLGPLYYSVDLGAVHVVVLDSEESPNGTTSAAQLAWLKSDLNRAFDHTPARQVLVLLHRALWQARPGEGNWRQVHSLLVAFNHKPIVSVEGIDSRESVNAAPRVAAVIAAEPLAGTGEYRMDPPLEGIHYDVLGPATGSVAGLSSPVSRAIGLVTFRGSQMTLARVPLDAPVKGETLDGEDAVTAQERAVVDSLQRLDEGALGLTVAGTTLQVRLSNPLAAALEVRVVLRNGAPPPALLGDQLGAGILSPGSWMLVGNRSAWTTLQPQAKERWDMTLLRTGGVVNAVPAELEFQVRWRDGRGRAWVVTFARSVPAGA